ncbi:translation initiation factor IF-2 [Lactobacillus delbrueckii subsp. lactis]|jgi:translation initiation factor IF-2|uniref:Translation initiation factor IF-2 n=3 Tax=Lactobacillus TaxID=1578 RepID=A0ABD4W248_9LACO|nr:MULTISPECIES: translation initiation factor IF-2 [Lactobacillus]ADQ61310.1 Translation initiation factor IF-2 [Lactobacillus delbrueckii subsp. bulgaricus ND02]APG66825.1 translation initiation factor IF-2 [Lactobacillus delbrueckii subsp. lactis]APG69099.1 translation initiation factor IF-2 [Lactobacillus delbrueckii subsp. lactis]ARR36918.1 translation initiation factor IF-2 [Lactobacillus delbrueckii subsp. delbrueckii]ASW64086.1 translation initiation factor IF-2 [Lactobacillus delbruec
MTKKQENETSKELGMDNKKTSGKSGKLKISVSAIRKGEKKTEGKRSNTRRRANNHSNDHSKRRRPAAQDLLKDLKQKQRADEARLDQESKAAKHEYKKSLNKAEASESKPVVKKVESAEKPAETAAEAPKVRGPKILKPSPARLKQNQANSEKPAAKPSSSRRPSSRPSFTEAPMPENKEGRRRKSGKPGRKGQNSYANQGRGANSDRSQQRKRKNKKHQSAPQVKKQVTQRKDRPLPESFEYEVGMNAQDLGKILHREPAEIVKKLFMLGIMINQNQSLDKGTIELLAADYGIEAVEKVHEDISDIDNIFAQEMEESKNSENQVVRPPVVTIMGHVDHGKTTLLDRLRHTRVSEHEAGGITQNIGAYQVRINDRLITFLDTPGHAAFSSMRARGAEITDIVVLIVAADDGVMPQTIEAIDHAKSAGVPIIVAINKMDRPGANPAHVTEQLMQYELIPENYGGSTIFVNISAKTGMGIDELLENIILEADMLELKADPKQKAIGTVIEARLSRGKGPVADVLIQQGTLRVGDPIVVGDTFGRVRTMTNDKGHQVKKATPSMPVEITGLNDVPESADKLVVFADEKTARAVGEARAQQSLQKQRENVQHVTLDNLFDTMKRESMKSVDIVLKADVQGSAEALAQSLQKIDVEGVRVNIIHSGVGAINESDVTLASASNALIIGFNVRPTATAKSQAAQEGVDIRLYSIIYKAIDDVKAAMQGMLEPTYEEKVIGNLTVRETWKVSKIGTIAGAFVDNGYVTRESGIRVIRDGVVKYDGKVASLRRFKDDVKEVKAGFDCGLTIENFNDIKEGDELEAYEMQEVKPG